MRQGRKALSLVVPANSEIIKKMAFKISKYIYILQKDCDTYILFSGVTKKFLLVAKQKVPQYVMSLQKLSLKENIPKEHQLFFLKMKEIGFLVDEQVDELATVLAEEEAHINVNNLQTIIIPTYDCNYSCWYCTQRHEKTLLDDLHVKKIERHITAKLQSGKIASFSLSWFGGEPLIQKDRIIEISTYLHDWCQQHDVDYYGQMTTNGALLNPQSIRQLEHCGIDRYQITIDGRREIHNRTKREKLGKSSFDIVLNNVKSLLEINIRSLVVLRLNYDNKKLKDLQMVEEINALIPTVLRRRIHVDMERIWQSETEEDIASDLYRLMEAFAESGYRLSTASPFSACYAEGRNFETIYYNGKVDFCDNYAANQTRGSILDNGDIDWDIDIPARMIGTKSGTECLSCKFFPVCRGESIAQRDRRLSRSKPFKCLYEEKDKLEFKILDYCFRCMLNKKYQEK